MGHVSVDTGTIIIADPCNLDQSKLSAQENIDRVIKNDLLQIFSEHEKEFEGITWEEVRSRPDIIEVLESYRSLSGSTTFENTSSYFHASKTGFGDGKYPVYANVEEERILGLFIDFD